MAAAYAARKLGIPATIVVPSTTPALTIERLKNEGAIVKVVGEVSTNPGQGPRRASGGRAGSPSPSPPPTSAVVLQMLDEAFELAKALAKNNPGWVYIPPFDDPLIWYVEPRVLRRRWGPSPIPLGGHLPQCMSSPHGHSICMCWACQQAQEQVHMHGCQCPFPVAMRARMSSDAHEPAARSPES